MISFNKWSKFLFWFTVYFGSFLISSSVNSISTRDQAREIFVQWSLRLVTFRKKCIGNQRTWNTDDCFRRTLFSAETINCLNAILNELAECLHYYETWWLTKFRQFIVSAENSVRNIFWFTHFFRRRTISIWKLI